MGSIVFVGVVAVMLVNIPMFTLYERKVLSYIQNRKGPNKVSFMGLLQPVADGLKLLLKQLVVPISGNFVLFSMSPMFSFVLMCSGWFFFFVGSSSHVLYLSILMFLCVSSVSIFGLLGSGWGSNSKYALLGSLRGCMQVMAYEMGLLTLILLPVSFKSSWAFKGFLVKNIFLGLFLAPVVVLFFCSMVAETNRAPFDFAEGESELVSGFNVEFGSFSFALLFLAEYGSMILVSMITALMFMGGSWLSLFFFAGKVLCFVFLVLRGSFPRWRVDLLSNFGWTVLFPFGFFYLFAVFMM